MARILVYSHDTFGLGNIRRMVRIAETLVARDPQTTVLLITGSPMLHAFRLPARIDYVKLPCLARNVHGVYGVKHLDLDYQAALRMRASLILSAAADFAPDVVIVDKKPTGVGGELAATLEMLCHRIPRPRMHLLLRDILDTPEATIPIWAANGYHQTIDTYYDSVLIAGDPQIFDAAERYEFPVSTRQRVRYCGYIDRSARGKPRNIDRHAPPSVLVQAGGGEDGAAILETFLRAVPILGDNVPFRARMIGGPELDQPTQLRLKRLAAETDRVEWRDFSDDMLGELAAADIVVAMGGYNSICEILSMRKAAIIVPRDRPVREQRIRAEAMAALGLFTVIPREQLTPRKLMMELRRLLGRRNVVASQLARVDFKGLERIADCVLGPNISGASVQGMQS